MERNIALYHGLIREQELRCPVRKLPHDGRSVCPSTTPAIGCIGSGRVKKRQSKRERERGGDGNGEKGSEARLSNNDVPPGLMCHLSLSLSPSLLV